MVIFKTDIGVTRSGFRLEWYNDGCGGILTHPEGSFTTPRYPKGYPISTECNWTVQVEPGRNIELTFLDVDMETPDCFFDYISVRISELKNDQLKSSFMLTQHWPFSDNVILKNPKL